MHLSFLLYNNNQISTYVSIQKYVGLNFHSLLLTLIMIRRKTPIIINFGQYIIRDRLYFYKYSILLSCRHHIGSGIHHLHNIVSCGVSRLNTVISKTCLTPLPSLPPSAPAIRPSVSHRRVHRPLLHGLQAVHYSAQSGLASQSGRYLTHTHTNTHP